MVPTKQNKIDQDDENHPDQDELVFMKTETDAARDDAEVGPTERSRSGVDLAR